MLGPRDALQCGRGRLNGRPIALLLDNIAKANIEQQAEASGAINDGGVGRGTHR